MTQQPPVWDDVRFTSESLIATDFFRDERMREDVADYSIAFIAARTAVEELLEASVDLSELRTEALTLLTEPDTLEAVRYLAGPPISQDDMMTIAKVRLSPFALKSNPEMVTSVIDTVLLGIDRNRFGWLSEDREPTEAERTSAIIATAALIATQRIATDRRNAGKVDQESRVKEALVAEGFREVSTRTVVSLADAPAVGEFCAESMFGQKKADVIVRLWDGRVMPLECKVSNSGTNSVKRLGEIANKADLWIRDLGRTQVVPGGVLAGVFKVKNLREAQGNGLTIWWSHDLITLTNWIASTRA